MQPCLATQSQTSKLDIMPSTKRSNQLGLQVSLEKSKLIQVGDGPNPPIITSRTVVAEFMNSFNSLGSTATNTCNLNGEINQCQSLATAIM